MNLNILSQEAAKLREFGRETDADRFQIALESQIIEIAVRVAEARARCEKQACMDAAFGRNCVQVAAGIIEDARKYANNLRYSENMDG